MAGALHGLFSASLVNGWVIGKPFSMEWPSGTSEGNCAGFGKRVPGLKMLGEQLPLPPVLPDVCRIKHGGHPRSEEANVAIHPHKTSIRWRIYEALSIWGPMTLDELVVALNLPIQTASGRVSELKQRNLIAEIPGQTRRTRSGCQAAILRVIGEWKD
jgi:hypothetical protein